MRPRQSQRLRLHFGQHDRAAARGARRWASGWQPRTRAPPRRAGSGGQRAGASGGGAARLRRLRGCESGPRRPGSPPPAAAPEPRGGGRGGRGGETAAGRARARLREGGGGGGGGEGAAARGADPDQPSSGRQRPGTGASAAAGRRSQRRDGSATPCASGSGAAGTPALASPLPSAPLRPAPPAPGRERSQVRSVKLQPRSPASCPPPAGPGAAPGRTVPEGQGDQRTREVSGAGAGPAGLRADDSDRGRGFRTRIGPQAPANEEAAHTPGSPRPPPPLPPAPRPLPARPRPGLGRGTRRLQGLTRASGDLCLSAAAAGAGAAASASPGQAAGERGWEGRGVAGAPRRVQPARG